MAKFQVTVIKIEEVESMQKEYQKISDDGNKLGDGPVYGYVDKGMATKQVETEIFRQILDDIDLTAVVTTLNK